MLDLFIILLVIISSPLPVFCNDNFNLINNLYDEKKIHNILKKTGKTIDKLSIKIKNINNNNDITFDSLGNFLSLNPLTPSELMHLLENGVLLSKNNFFIEIKTGYSYGDFLSLNEQFFTAINTLKKDKIIPEDISVLEILSSAHKKDIIEFYEAKNIPWQDVLSDIKQLEKIKQYLAFFSIINSYSWYNIGSGGNIGSNPPSVNPLSSFGPSFNPKYLSMSILYNLYVKTSGISVNSNIAINPFSLGYSSSLFYNQGNVGWWTYFSDGYLGAGLSFTPIFEHGLFRNPLQPGYNVWNIFFGGYSDNNNDRMNAGLSFQSLIAKTTLFGPSFSVNLGHFHDAKYLGEYPLDGKIPRLRGLHGIELVQNTSLLIRAGLSGGNFIGSLNPYVLANINIAKGKIKHRFYKTHVSLSSARKLLKKKDVNFLLKLLGKSKKNQFFPSLSKPDSLLVGDELTEKRSGTLNGAFILGFQSSTIPIYSLMAGLSFDITAEHEITIKKLTPYKYEISIEINKLKECSLMQNILNIIFSSQINGIDIAKKQVFLFDFTYEEARKSYFDLMNNGKLPNKSQINFYHTDKTPEYIISQFRYQNKQLYNTGITLIFLENINITTKKLFSIIAPPVIPAVLDIINRIDKKVHEYKASLNLRFDGVGYESLKGKAFSVSTNGIVASSRQTSAIRKTFRQGSSGLLQKDLFVVHRKLHTVIEKENNYVENKYVFDGLNIYAQIYDTVITCDEENKIINKINKQFSTYIPNCGHRNSRQPRKIKLERILDRQDLAFLASNQPRENIKISMASSGLTQEEVLTFLESLKGRNQDDQALIIKNFIETQKGFRGFSCIHHLLGPDEEKLTIKVEGNYQNIANEANKLIVTYSSINKLELLNSHKIIKKFHSKLRVILIKIDEQLKLLYRDPYYIEEENSDYIFDQEKKIKLINLGVRESKKQIAEPLLKAKKSVLQLLDLRARKFTKNERIKIYNIIGKKHLTYYERGEMILWEKPKNPPEDFLIGLKKEIKKIQDDHELMAIDKKNQTISIEKLSKLGQKISPLVSFNKE